MGEKRKLPPRGGESAARRKLSEAAPKRDTTPAKRKASATPTMPPSPEPEKKILPIKIKDGSPLPTLSKPQPSTLSLREYQSYAERYAPNGLRFLLNFTVDTSIIILLLILNFHLALFWLLHYNGQG